ncbi:hypothetical protein D9M69_342990 [compost metagenome]
MFCCGEWKSRSAAVKLAQSRASFILMPAWKVRSSGRSAVHWNATTYCAPSGPAAADSGSATSETTGPWRVLRTFSVTSGAPLMRMVSVRVSKLAQPSGVWYWVSLPGRSRSINRSCTSGAVLVKPHAMRSLCPSTTTGMPGSVAPATSSPGAVMRAKYHSAGACRPRCGSLASIGLPDCVCAPETTQLFEPMPST